MASRPLDHSRRSRVAPLWLAIAATALGLLLAYGLKSPCTRHHWGGTGRGQESYEYSRLCYNDLQPLFEVRGIGKGLMPYRDVQLEYPVLTGMFMDATGRLLRGLSERSILENTNPHYFTLSAILLAPFALAVTLLLRTHVRADRLMIWAVGSPIVLYSFHNWDLLAVAGATWGLVAIERGRDAEGGVALGLGASAKLYPAFFLPPALLARFHTAGWRGTRPLLVWFVLAALLVNLPWIFIASGVSPIFDDPRWAEVASSIEIRSPEKNGWLGIWTYHAGRYPDFGTVWFWIAHHGRRLFPATWWSPGQAGYRDFVSVMSLALFAASSSWFLIRGWRRRTQAEGYPVAAVSLGIVCLFLLVSKVHSPQYALWVAPLLAMVAVPWRAVLAYLGVDLAVYVSGFYWFTVFDAPAPAWKGIFEVAVLSRAAALLWLIWWAARAGRLLPGAPPSIGESGKV